MQKTKIHKVGEHEIQIPIPSKGDTILFSNIQKPENQYWDRTKIVSQFKSVWFSFLPGFTKMWQAATIYNNDGLLVSLNDEDSDYVDGIYLQETDRRINGVHFMNNGEVTWLTGDHYFFLMYARMQRHDGKGQFGDYREFQRDYAYLIHHSCTSTFDGVRNILGLFLTKAKKTGITNFHWSGVYLNRATLYKNRNFGYMNIDLNQSAKTFNDYFMYSYNGLISPLRAEYRSRSLNEGSIVFAKSYTNSKKAKYNTDEDDINSTVQCVATKNKAFDVAVMYMITFDEPTKFKEPFDEIWRTNKESVKIQSKFNGWAWLFNYTPEDNGVSFMGARKIFYESELKTITPNSNGQTKSGLICHHIPACESWEGAFDKHGKCDKVKAMREIQQERDKVEGDNKALQAIIRQYANTKKEAWGSGGVTSVFDPIRLSELDLELEELQRAKQTFEWGHLEWENPMWEVGKKDKRPRGAFCNVRWVPLSEEAVKQGKTDKMRKYEDIPPQDRNKVLSNGKNEYGNLIPPDRFDYCGGIDPVDVKDAGSFEEGSLIGMDTMAIHNQVRNTQAGRIVTKISYLVYYGRPDNSEEWLNDIVKQVIYTGMIFIIEANNGAVITRLEQEGLSHYMLWKNEEGVIVMYRENHKNIPGGKLKPIYNSKSQKTDIISDIITYNQNYLLKGNPDWGEIDYGKLIRDERLIAQYKEFDAHDTKKSDLVMKKGFSLMAHENYLALLSVVQDDRYKPNEVNAVIAALESFN